jgi:hypothetical protein
MIFTLLLFSLTTFDTVSLWVDSVFVIAERLPKRNFSITTETVYRPLEMRWELSGASSFLLRDFGGRMTPSVRGGNDEDTRVSLEGIEVNDPLWGFTPLNLFPPDFISKIKVGSFSNIPPLLGELSLTLRRESFVKLTAGDYGRRGLSLLYAKKELVSGVHLSRALNDFSYKDRFGREYRRMNNDESLFSAFLLKESSLRTFIYLSTLDLGLPRRGYGSEGRDRENYRFLITGVGNNRLFLNSVLQHYRFTSSEQEEERFISFRLEAGLKTPLKLSTSIVGVRGESLDRALLQFEAAEDVVLNLGSFYLIGTVGLNTRPSVSDGFIPLFSINLQKNAGPLAVHLGMRFSGKFPSLSELYWPEGGGAEGNPDLKPERSSTVELGFSLSKMGSHFINLYITEVEDGIYWLPEGELWRPKNITWTRFLGVELKGAITLETFRITHSLTLLNTTLKGGGVLPYRPKVWGRVDLSYRWVTFSVLGVGSRPTYFSENSFHLPPYVLFGLSLTKSLFFGKKSITLSLMIENLTDRSYEVISGYPMPGRNLVFSLSYTP